MNEFRITGKFAGIERGTGTSSYWGVLIWATRKGKDDKQESFQVKVSFFGDTRLAHFQQRVKSGDMLLLTGRIKGREFNDKWYFDLEGDDYYVISDYSERQPMAKKPVPASATQPAPQEVDDDCPF